MCLADKIELKIKKIIHFKVRWYVLFAGYLFTGCKSLKRRHVKYFKILY